MSQQAERQTVNRNQQATADRHKDKTSDILEGTEADRQ